MAKVEDVINELVLNPATIDMTYKYRNNVDLSGWVIRKPKFIKHDIKGVESCSLLLYQINNSNGEIKVECYSCMVYVKELVEQLKKQENVLFVATVGKLRYSPKIRGYYSQVVEMATLMELDVPLADEQEREQWKRLKKN